MARAPSANERHASSYWYIVVCMIQALFAIAIVAAALVCPAMLWLGRRGIGPGCAMCPPRKQEDSLEDLQARQRNLAAKIENFESLPVELVRESVSSRE